MSPIAFFRDVQLQLQLQKLDSTLRTVLPPQYQDSYQTLQPVSMGSAPLKYDPSGRVAWNQIWGSFCNLALAGGPPHKGKLLLPASPSDIAAHPAPYRAVLDEICRGIRLVSPSLCAAPSPHPGWVRLTCPSDLMASWLVRAINIENVSAILSDNTLDLPAGPHFRLEKEIKNVVTAVAKTSHYFQSHTSSLQLRNIAKTFAAANATSPLLQPARSSSPQLLQLHHPLAARLSQATHLPVAPFTYHSWIGLQTPSVSSAIWMTRALAVSNVLARREDAILYLPFDPLTDPAGDHLLTALSHIHRLATARGLIPPSSVH